MITQDILSPAIPLAQVLATNGKQILAQQNTLLSKLVDSLDEHTVHGSRVSEVVSIEPAFGTTSIPKPAYDRLLAEASTALAPKVKAHIAYAKSVVKPVVIDYLEFIKARKASYSAVTAESSVDVKVIDLPEIYRDASFVNNFDLYDGKDTDAVEYHDVKFGLPRKSTDEIAAMLVTGEAFVDEGIKVLVLSKQDSFLIDIWDEFFCSEAARTPITTSFRNVFETLDCMLIVYVLTLKLANEPEASVINQPLMAFKRRMDGMREAAGSTILKGLKTIASYEASGVLIIGLDSLRSSCTIFKPNFDKLLAQGGSMEVILGAASSSYKLSMLADVLRDKDELAARWKSYCMFYNARSVKDTINNFKGSLEIGFSEMITKNYAGTLSKEPTFSDFETKAMSIVAEIIKNATVKDMEDPRGIALAVIAKGMFYYTESYALLNRGEEIMESNPNTDAREAMLISAIEYIARYLADMMIVV